MATTTELAAPTSTSTTAKAIYTIDSTRRLGFDSLGELWRYRELFWALSVRSVKTRYRQSLLGAGWAIAQPVITMVIFTVVFSRIAKIDTGGVPYQIFSYSALVPWTFFANGVTMGTSSLVANRNIVTKLWFPREIILMSEVAARFVDFLSGAIVFVGLMAWYQVSLTPWLLFLPVLLAIQMLLIVGVTLITSSLHVRFRDLAPIVTLIVTVWLYATPIAYPRSEIPSQWQFVYSLNPMVGIIEGFRSVIAMGQPPDLGSVAMAAITTLLLLLVAYPWFKSRERTFADVI
jgi:lipopolysaccharide transport system permease protein